MSTMTRKKKIYEGKAKIIYEGDSATTVVQHFKDDITAFNSKKREILKGKGALTNLLSEHFMTGLESVGIKTHFIKRLNVREQLVKRCEIIPLEVVVRNLVAGSMAKRLKIPEGTHLPFPLVEFYFKNDDLGDPLVTESHAVAFNWASLEELNEIKKLALQTNRFLSKRLVSVNIRLVDFKIEIGRVLGKKEKSLVIADEISPDSCRLWEFNTGKKLDKDIFRQNLGNVMDGYADLASRLGLIDNTFTDFGVNYED